MKICPPRKYNSSKTYDILKEKFGYNNKLTLSTSIMIHQNKM